MLPSEGHLEELSDLHIENSSPLHKGSLIGAIDLLRNRWSLEIIFANGPKEAVQGSVYFAEEFLKFLAKFFFPVIKRKQKILKVLERCR